MMPKPIMLSHILKVMNKYLILMNDLLVYCT